MLLKPDLLPVALVFAGDLLHLAKGCLQFAQQAGEAGLVHGVGAMAQGFELALGHQIAIAANRRGGLHVGVQGQGEMGTRSNTKLAAAEAPFDGAVAHGTRGQAFQF